MPENDDLIIENARETDLEDILKLEKKAFKRPWSLESFKSELTHPDSFTKIAKQKSRICGFMIYRLFMEEMEVFKICTHEDFQNQGIASKLLESAFDSCKNKAKLALLEVNSSNEKALSFYKKHGFTVSGTRTNYYGQGQNALNMTKDLSGGLK